MLSAPILPKSLSPPNAHLKVCRENISSELGKFFFLLLLFHKMWQIGLMSIVRPHEGEFIDILTAFLLNFAFHRCVFSEKYPPINNIRRCYRPLISMCLIVIANDATPRLNCFPNQSACVPPLTYGCFYVPPPLVCVRARCLRPRAMSARETGRLALSTISQAFRRLNWRHSIPSTR